MALKLSDIKDYRPMYCVPIMLCATSDLTPDEAGVVLQRAAADFGVTIPTTLRNDYDIKHWLRAIKRLGGHWKEVESYADVLYSMRPSIDGILEHLRGTALYVIFGENEQCTETHVFAFQAGRLVDTYTDGKVEDAKAVGRAGYTAFRVKRVFVVTDATPS